MAHKRMADPQKRPKTKDGQSREGIKASRLITARSATAQAAQPYTPSEVRQIRHRLALSQPVFAQALNVSPETVRAWEQGKKQPGGTAARLLEIADEHPEWVLTSVEVR